jgi:hypothetical protein
MSKPPPTPPIQKANRPSGARSRVGAALHLAARLASVNSWYSAAAMGSVRYRAARG